MADFQVKSAIFRALMPELGATVSTALGRVVVRMAELLMNSANANFEPIRTNGG